MRNFKKKLFLSALTVILCFNSVSAQEASTKVIYEMFFKQLKADQRLKEETGSVFCNNCYCIYRKTIKTNFQAIQDGVLQKLENSDIDSLNKSLYLLDSAANRNFSPQKIAVCRMNQNCKFIVYFSKKYNNFIYAEVIPYIKTGRYQNLDEYRKEHMGKVFNYMIEVKEDRVILKKGFYFMQ